MTPDEAYRRRHGHWAWEQATKKAREDWLAAWTISGAINRQGERNACAKLCDEWARICDSGKRHGAKVGAQECAKLIRAQDQTEGEQ